MSAFDSGASPESVNVVQSSIDKARSVDFAEISKAAWSQKEDLGKVVHVQSPISTDNADMKGFQRDLKNFLKSLEAFKRHSEIDSFSDLFNSILSTAVSGNLPLTISSQKSVTNKQILKLVDDAAIDLSGYFKMRTDRVRAWTLNVAQERVKQVLPCLYPSEQSKFLTKIRPYIDALSSAWVNAIRKLYDIIKDLLIAMADKMINSPMCFAEDIVNTIFDLILPPIQAALDALIAIICSYRRPPCECEPSPNIKSQLYNALDFKTGVSNFFSSDEDQKSPPVQEISLSGAGQNNSQGGDPAGSAEGASSKISTSGVAQGDQSVAIDIRTANSTDTGIDQALNDSKANKPVGNNDLNLF